jgi:alkylation response protein AidB-like acyl-CoA dehydrogenase
MDFELDQDQQMLAKTVGEFAKNESPVARFRQLRDSAIGYQPAAWRKMGELGWMGVPFPESVGGFGGSFIDCALIIENLATTLVPEPYLASVVLGGMTLARAGNAAQHEAYLTPMIEAPPRRPRRRLATTTSFRARRSGFSTGTTPIT